MNREIFEILYKTEETHWWFVGQRFLLGRYLRKYYRSKKKLTLLDVGCGTGFNLKMLSVFGTVYGIDVSDDALRFCKIRGAKNVKKSNVMNLKFKDNTFDVVTSLGVFYHKNVENDIKGLKEIYRVLKPGGMLFFIDAAMKCLFGKHTVAFEGVRRYSKTELSSKLQEVGFDIKKISYFNTLFFPFVFISRKASELARLKPKSDIKPNINPLLNYILRKIYKTELLGLKYFNYPFGVNIFAIGRRPK